LCRGQVGIGREESDVPNDEPTAYCIGYQEQLKRTRRALARMHGPFDSAVEFQDSAWSFFQHCWHLRDWLRHDSLVPEVAKVTVLERVRQSATLQTCRALCDGSRHLGAKPVRLLHPVRTMAADQSHVDRESAPNDGLLTLVAGTAFASECLAEWESILGAGGLAVARRD
jgi:hypothetical protein